jgi:hypothetical protein
VFERPVTIPDYFWDAATDVERCWLHRLSETFGILLPSGSRFICPGKHAPDADFDVFALGSSRDAHELLGNGWECPDYGGQKPEDAAGRASKADRSISLYHENINLILFFDQSKVSLFAQATSFSRQLGVESRDQRVKVFKAICREN